MNYLPLVGYWFYGGTSASETASYFASSGLLASAPSGATVFTQTTTWFWNRFLKVLKGA